ncbi:hypothetical protein D9758_012398 [Tetrapyrgos nigripes]|uniref:Enoyl reductase (ER) domain-containing protein n=1 Tax=Tetrapyrgos nigripes TaxID=182062 RepID=A0A8H5D867_9AGAR|nr:hypothetical protein D9758_012398 [Tetrapyrgos nigripes]
MAATYKRIHANDTPRTNTKKPLSSHPSKAPSFYPGPSPNPFKVHAVALNPADQKIQALGIMYAEDKYPIILGLGIAGEVVDVSDNVNGYQSGDRVFFAGGTFENEYAGYQEYTRVPADIVAKIPPNLSYSQAASLSVGFATAAIGLYASHPIGLGLNPSIQPGIEDFKDKGVLVISASGSVGEYAYLAQTAIQLLRYLRFSSIIAYASSTHFARLRSLGATHFVDRKKVSFSALPTIAQSITPNPIIVVYDAFGSPEAQQAGYDTLVEKGKLASVNRMTEPRGEGKTFIGVYGNVHVDRNRSFGRKMYEKLPKLLEDGVFVPNEIEVLKTGLEGIVDGLRRIKDNKTGGAKLVVHPQETS